MIHRVRVQNFKSIRDITVNLSSVTVLVGRSGAGKSNFVDSLRFLRELVSSDPKSQDINRVVSYWSRSRPAATQNASTAFEIQFSIPGINEIFDYMLVLHPDGPARAPQREKLLLGDKCLYDQQSTANHQHSWITKPNLVQVPDAGAIALGRIPSISEIVIAYTALTSGIGVYAFHDRVLVHEASKARGGQFSTQSGEVTGLRDDAANYLDTLREIMTNLHDLSVRRNMVTALKRVNPSVSSIELDDVQKPSHVIVGHEFDGKILSLDLSQESDGFRRLYACLLALYQKPPKQTLLFEHPEDGIHPGALSLLAEEFKSTPGDNRGQVILTTHSPMLLDQFEPDQIRVVALEGLETRIGQISHEQREAIEEQLLDAGELLTVDPARIEMSSAEPAEA
jgi:predicted ATPase